MEKGLPFPGRLGRRTALSLQTPCGPGIPWGWKMWRNEPSLMSEVRPTSFLEVQDQLDTQVFALRAVCSGQRVNKEVIPQ